MSRIDQFKPRPGPTSWEDDLAELTWLDRVRVGWERPAVKWLAFVLAVVVCLILWNMKSGLANSGQNAADLVETSKGEDPPGGPSGTADGPLPAQGASVAAGTSPVAVTSVTVHVIGPVRRPGVVSLAPGSRVADALTAVGGMRSGQPKINLARLLVDGEQLNPAKVDGGAGGAAVGANAGVGAGVQGQAGGKINLNSATSEQLQQLPRVGPATAQKILDFRTTNGAFKSVDQLQEIPGIGEKTLAALAPLLSV